MGRIWLFFWFIWAAGFAGYGFAMYAIGHDPWTLGLGVFDILLTLYFLGRLLSSD